MRDMGASLVLGGEARHELAKPCLTVSDPEPKVSRLFEISNI
jgi:hypothetical protein